MRGRVLLIEDDDAMRASLTQSLELEDMVVIQANGLAQARRTIRANFAGVVLSDIRMPGQDGFAVLERAQAIDPDLPVIFLTGEADVPMAVRALQNGVYDFLEKPCGVETLVATVRRALRHRDLVLQSRHLASRLEHSDAAAIHFPGRSTASSRLRRDLRRASSEPANVHFHGDEGVGKRLAAHTLYVLSGTDAPVLSVNFAKPTEGGQLDAYKGLRPFVILKNVEASSAEVLCALPGILTKLDPVRIVATSAAALGPDHPLDLWAPTHIPVPNLRQRAGDLHIIFESLLRQSARELDIDKPEVHPEVLIALDQRDWTGNLPELRQYAREILTGVSDADGSAQAGLVDQMHAFERSVLMAALQRANGRVALAAKHLNLPRKTLYDKLAKHGIQPRSVRES